MYNKSYLTDIGPALPTEIFSFRHICIFKTDFFHDKSIDIMFILWVNYD